MDPRPRNPLLLQPRTHVPRTQPRPRRCLEAAREERGEETRADRDWEQRPFVESCHLALEGQKRIEALRIDVPGPDKSVFAAIEAIAPSLLALHLGNSYSTPSSTWKYDTTTSSPLLPILVRATRLEELALLDFVRPQELNEILELPFEELRKLVIDDWITSGMRTALKEVLEVGELSALEEVVSVGMKKTNGVGSASGKAFAKECRKAGIRWKQEE